MCTCVCVRTDHLCLSLLLCEARIAIWRDLISHNSTPNMSAGVGVCVCAPCGVISHQHRKHVTLKHHRVDSSSDIWVFISPCRLTHFYLRAHIFLRRIWGHVTNLWSAQRHSEERESQTERGGFTKSIESLGLPSVWQRGHILKRWSQ